MAEYAKPSLTGEMSCFTQNPDGSLFTVVDVSSAGNRHHADISLAVPMLNDLIIIEHDINNKPLIDTMLQAGIPRSQIILAYAGEAVPESA
jgi:hypothetical protein